MIAFALSHPLSFLLTLGGWSSYGLVAVDMTITRAHPTAWTPFTFWFFVYLACLLSYHVVQDNRSV